VADPTMKYDQVGDEKSVRRSHACVLQQPLIIRRKKKKEWSKEIKLWEVHQKLHRPGNRPMAFRSNCAEGMLGWMIA